MPDVTEILFKKPESAIIAVVPATRVSILLTPKQELPRTAQQLIAMPGQMPDVMEISSEKPEPATTESVPMARALILLILKKEIPRTAQQIIAIVGRFAVVTAIL